jgi:cell division protein FtsB
MPLPSLATRPSLRRRILLIGLAVLVGWLVFFDSHSLLRRVSYYPDLRQVSAENERLQAENADLAERLQSGLSDATVEKVAREQYGMRRPGETIYRVETEE